MPGFLTSPVSISVTGLTLNTFGARTCPTDSAGLTGIPSNATGVILNFVAGSVANAITLRMTGSTDTQTTSNSLSANTQCFLCVGVNSSGQFDCRLTNVTAGQTVTIFLVGFFTSGEAVFFQNAIQVTSALPSTNTTFNTSTFAPGARAVFLWCGAFNTGYFRQTGSTDTVAASGFVAAPCGVNTSGQFDAKSTGSPAVYCFGYMVSGIVWNTNAVSRTISTTGSFTNIPNGGDTRPVGFMYGPGSSSASTAANYTLGGPGINTGTYNPNVPSNANQRPFAGGPTAQINTNTSGVMLEQCYFTASNVLAITNGSTFTAPGDFPGTADAIYLIGGGGAGLNSNATTGEGTGGGGGAIQIVTNGTTGVSISNGSNLQIGTGGGLAGANGQDTWLITNSTYVAKGGQGGQSAAGGAGGAAASCIPGTGTGTASFSGGAGATFTGHGTGGDGGGGAAGLFGAGAAGGNSAVTANSGGGGGGGNGGGSAGGSASTTSGASGGNNVLGAGGGAGGAGNGGAASAGGGGAGSATGNFTSSSGANGSDWTLPSGGGAIGSGGGGGGGSNTNDNTVGNGGLYGGGGGSSGNSTFTKFGIGASGLILIVYTPQPVVNSSIPWLYTRRNNMLYIS